MKIIVAGGTGLIGRALVPRLTGEGHEVILLTRTPLRQPPARGVTPAGWDGLSAGSWSEHLRTADAVVNLAGESIGAGRWTPRRKSLILASRLNATRALLGAIAGSDRRPRVFVSGSAVGYYGSVESGDVTEEHSPGEGFLADVCLRWEQQAFAAGELGLRVVILRNAVVLGAGAEAIRRMALPFRLFAGGPLGTGRQWFPWVHVDDVAGAILHALTHASLSGPVNVAAPEYVDNRAFSAALGRALARPSWLPAPAFALRLVLGEMADMILTGQRVLPSKLVASGYAFRYPALAPALASTV